MHNSFFLNNKYTKCYFKIINAARSSDRQKLAKTNVDYIYYELHHIIPKSLECQLQDLKKNPENGILLTPKEHFICHLLLTKMTTGENLKKMRWAFHNLNKKNKHQLERYTSRMYDKNKSKLFHTDATKLKMSISRNGVARPGAKGRVGSMLGKKHNPESIEKMKLTKQQNQSSIGENNGMFGKTHSDETKIKISKAKSGKSHSKEHAEKLRGKVPWNKGLTKSDPRVLAIAQKMASTRYST